MKTIVLLIAVALLSGCAKASLDIEGDEKWAVFTQSRAAYGEGTASFRIERGSHVTVQILEDGTLRTRVRLRHHDTEWRSLREKYETTEFNVP